MKDYIPIVVMFFAPVIFAAYCWGLHEIIAQFIIERPLSYFATSGIVVMQVGGLMITGGTGTHDD